MRTTKRRGWGALAISAPLGVFLLLFFFLPLAALLLTSFHRFDAGSGIDSSVFTIANYAKFVTDPYYVGVLVRTLKLSVITTLLCMLIAYPVAYHIASVGGRAQNYLLLVYLTPWLISLVVKSFGWQVLLAPNGIVNAVLMWLRVIDRPLILLWSETGIVIGLIHVYLVFAVLPVFSSLIGIDANLQLASLNLGAGRLRTLTRVTLPLSLPGVVAGTLIVFCLSMSAFVTPAILGGARVPVVSYLVYQESLETLNWPFGAAISFLLLVTTAAFLLVYHSVVAGRLARVSK